MKKRKERKTRSTHGAGRHTTEEDTRTTTAIWELEVRPRLRRLGLCLRLHKCATSLFWGLCTGNTHVQSGTHAVILTGNSLKNFFQTCKFSNLEKRQKKPFKYILAFVLQVTLIRQIFFTPRGYECFNILILFIGYNPKGVFFSHNIPISYVQQMVTIWQNI